MNPIGAIPTVIDVKQEFFFIHSVSSSELNFVSLACDMSSNHFQFPSVFTDNPSVGVKKWKVELVCLSCWYTQQASAAIGCVAPNPSFRS